MRRLSRWIIGSLIVILSGMLYFAPARAVEIETDPGGTVGKLDREAPKVYGVAETVLGKKDGTMLGLTTEMELSRNEEGPYTPVTEEMVSAFYEPGTYFARYKEDATYKPSMLCRFDILPGEPLHITVDPESFPSGMFRAESDTAAYGSSVRLLADDAGIYYYRVVRQNGKEIRPDEHGDFLIENITEDVTVVGEETRMSYIIRMEYELDGEQVSVAAPENDWLKILPISRKDADTAYNYGKRIVFTVRFSYTQEDVPAEVLSQIRERAADGAVLLKQTFGIRMSLPDGTVKDVEPSEPVDISLNLPEGYMQRLLDRQEAALYYGDTEQDEVVPSPMEIRPDETLHLKVQKGGDYYLCVSDRPFVEPTEPVVPSESEDATVPPSGTEPTDSTVPSSEKETDKPTDKPSEGRSEENITDIINRLNRNSIGIIGIWMLGALGVMLFLTVAAIVFGQNTAGQPEQGEAED